MACSPSSADTPPPTLGGQAARNLTPVLSVTPSPPLLPLLLLSCCEGFWTPHPPLWAVPSRGGSVSWGVFFFNQSASCWSVFQPSSEQLNLYLTLRRNQFTPSVTAEAVGNRTPLVGGRPLVFMTDSSNQEARLLGCDMTGVTRAVPLSCLLQRCIMGIIVIMCRLPC